MLTEMEIERLIRKDKIIVLLLLAGLALMAWTYMVHMAPPSTSGMVMGEASPCMMQWGFPDILLSLVMWSIMMVAMMLPAATPMVLMFASVNRQQNQQSVSLISTGSFVLGYLIIWIVYSGISAIVQWGLHSAALLSHSMVISSPVLGGSLLLAAGVFQWTPFRDACMKKCRSPLGFILSEWREGKAGALIMGIKHGMYCVGCCWILMSLSLVLGVMNLLWMAVLTVFMVLEKTGAVGSWLSRAAGLVFIVWGLTIIIIKGLPF